MAVSIILGEGKDEDDDENIGAHTCGIITDNTGDDNDETIDGTSDETIDQVMCQWLAKLFRCGNGIRCAPRTDHLPYSGRANPKSAASLAAASVLAAIRSSNRSSAR